MLMSYTNPISEETGQIECQITKDHPASSYGQPVVIHPDGNPLGASDLVMCNYRAVSATPEELEMLEKVSSALAMAVS